MQSNKRTRTGNSNRCTRSTSSMLILRLRTANSRLPRSTLIFFHRSIPQQTWRGTASSKRLERAHHKLPQDKHNLLLLNAASV
jgi:hypothetical protein